jgi:hypothetical protein
MSRRVDHIIDAGSDHGEESRVSTISWNALKLSNQRASLPSESLWHRSFTNYKPEYLTFVYKSHLILFATSEDRQWRFRTPQPAFPAPTQSVASKLTASCSARGSYFSQHQGSSIRLVFSRRGCLSINCKDIQRVRLRGFSARLRSCSFLGDLVSVSFPQINV